MKHKKDVSRWFNKRISHHFKQAGLGKTYDLLLSTIVDGSGMKKYKKIGTTKQ
jgi:hypothetical protein